MLLRLMMLLAGFGLSFGQIQFDGLRTPGQQNTCQKLQQSTVEPVGRFTIAGCPLILRRPGSSRNKDPDDNHQPLLLEPSACLTPSDLRAACGRRVDGVPPLAFNYVRRQHFFRLTVRLHHPALLAAAAKSAGAWLAIMQPTEVSVSLVYRPKHFTVDNARLVGTEGEAKDGSNGTVGFRSWSAEIGVYCNREEDCSQLQGKICTEPDYFLEIMELRMTAEIVPGCYKTVKMSKKVSLMTQDLMENVTKRTEPSAERRDVAGKNGSTCDERENVRLNVKEITLLEAMKRKFGTVSGDAVAFYNFRRSCRNLLALPEIPWAETARSQSAGPIKDASVQWVLDVEDSAMIFRLKRQDKAQSNATRTLSIYIQYRVTNNSLLTEGLIRLTSGGSGCADSMQRSRKTTLSVTRTATGASIKDLYRRRQYAAQSKKLLKPLDAGNRDAIGIVLTESHLKSGFPPTIFLGEEQLALALDRFVGATTDVVDTDDCWQLRLGDGLTGVVNCVFVAFASSEQLDLVGMRKLRSACEA